MSIPWPHAPGLALWGYRPGRTNERQRRCPAYPCSRRVDARVAPQHCPILRGGNYDSTAGPGDGPHYPRIVTSPVLLKTGAGAWEDFASDLSFEAADNLGLAPSFPGAASHIRPGLVIITKPDHNDPIKSGIGYSSK
jgi:hypothetical protein